MNIELRSQFLAWSLTIEDLLANVLSQLFRFERDSSKTLGNTSQSLSLKTKADLLKDLERIPQETYDDLVCFMQFRNQFIHNIKTDSLVKAGDRLRKADYLLSLKPGLKKAFYMAEHEQEQEAVLLEAFEAFFHKLFHELKSLVEQVSEEIKFYEETRRKAEERNFFKNFNMVFALAVEEFSKEFDEMISSDDETAKYKGLIKNGMLVHLKRQLGFLETE